MNEKEESVKITTLKAAARAKRVLFAFACALTLALAAQAGDGDKEKQQKQIREMAQDTLQRLYKADPQARAVIKRSAGYAVFSDLGVKILFAGSGNGKGIAVNNRTKHETFMKMLEVQAGLGMGVEKFRTVFVFDNKKAFEDFIGSGWQFGGQSTAAAKNEDKGGAMGGAVSVSDGVWIYQLTDKGLAADISATGTKYYRDNDLN
jgi:lipid-binding SYLF domain-containing protein